MVRVSRVPFALPGVLQALLDGGDMVYLHDPVLIPV